MTKKKVYDPKKRNFFHRQRKRIVLISAEGKNKTEYLYFKRFSNDTYVIKSASGNSTDPVNMVKNLINDCKAKELNSKDGDLAFCLVDADIDEKKNDQLAKAVALAQKNQIQLIVSAPCFEIWYLCHFCYSTKHYKSNEDVINDLKQHLPHYQKSTDSMFEELQHLNKTAIINAKKLEKHNLNLGNKLHTVEFSPSTEVYKIIEKLTNN